LVEVQKPLLRKKYFLSCTVIFLPCPVDPELQLLKGSKSRLV
jgi:hypothetical protein